MIVQLGEATNGCTGTLITPQIVLTANHCIWGAQAENSCRSEKTLLRVTLGRDAPIAGKPSVDSVDAETVFGGCQPTGFHANDLAVLYLRTPVTPFLFPKDSPFVPKVVQPRLLPFTDPAFHVGGTFGVAGYGGAATARRAGTIQNAAFGYSLQGSFYKWTSDTASFTTEEGDSGGPLFYQHPDGRREVVGALFGQIGDDKTWASIASGAGKQWLLEHVKESNVPLALRHTPQWLSQHGRTLEGPLESWWGELDYSGPCQPAVDRDCDGWWDRGGPVHDNCIFIANPDQLDTNHDGVGDVCQACPFDPDNDADEDGICAIVSPHNTLSKPDNCPNVKNDGRNFTIDQRNCNEKAEEVRRRDPSSTVEVLGDACDPVPCPRTRALASGEYRHPVGGGHPMIGGFFSGRVISDDIETTRVSPHVKTPAPVNVPVPRDLGETTTLGRFCQQNFEQFYRCDADASIRDSALTDVSSANIEPLDPEMPWHRVTLGVNGMNRDWTFWQGRIPPAEPHYQATCTHQDVGAGTCLDGTLWYHAATPVGATNPHSNGHYVGLHGAGLANHYVKVTPDRAYMKTYAGTGLMRKFFFLIHTLPDPAPYETILRPRVRPLVAAAEFDLPHVIEDHGGSWDASAMVSYVTADTLQTSGVVWAGAVEPTGIAGNLDPRVQAMALSADGTYVFDTTLLDQGMLVSAVELGYPHASGDAMGAPSPRTGFATVLSRLAGGVFVIGGRDIETNARLGDIHLFRPDVGWSTIPSEVQFGDVKSATFAPSDGRLWILEQRSSSYSIVRVNPWTGQATSLGTWPRGSVWDQHFLAVDRDGGVVLVAASHANQRSKFGRLRVDGAGAAYATYVDAGVIPYTTSAPIVDKDEYGLIVRNETGAVSSIFRRANLVRSTATTTLDHFFQ